MRKLAAFSLFLLLSACASAAQTAKPAPTAEGCTNLQQSIDQMRDLRETYATHETNYRKAIAQRDVARDALYRAGGPLDAFLSAARGFDTRNESAALKKLIGTLRPIGSTADLSAALRGVYGAPEVAKDAAAKEAMRAVMVRVKDAFEKRGDPEFAMKIYTPMTTQSAELTGAAKKATAGIRMLPAALGYADKTAALVAVMQTWYQQNDIANEARTHMDEVREQIDALQSRIDVEQAGCSSVKAEKALAATTLAPAIASDKTMAIWARVLDLQSRLADLPIHYGSAAMWMLPYLLDEGDGVEPRLVPMLVEAALPSYESIVPTFTEAAIRPDVFRQEVENAIPKGTK